MTKLLLFPDIETSPSLTSTPSGTRTGLIWAEGRRFLPSEYDFSNLEFVCETLPTGEMTDFAAADIGAPIVSEKLKTVLDRFDVPVQYFPVDIYETEGVRPSQEYYAMNILEMADCIDFDASELDVEKEDGEIVDILEVGTMVLKDDSFGDMYRMDMFWRVIVVEGQLAEKLRDLDVPGMKLIQPEKWNGIASEK